MGLLDALDAFDDVIDVLGEVETVSEDTGILTDALTSIASTAGDGVDTLKELQDDAKAGKPPGTLRTAFEIGSFLLRRS